MSRRKQTKPFKVEDEIEAKNEKKAKLKKILPKPDEASQAELLSSQSDNASENFSDDCEEELDSTARRSKRHTKCNQCGKMLASALSLARHRLTHSEKKPYQCPKCDSSFKTSSNMHRHLRIHFREANDEPEEPPKPASKTTGLRTPRQNIRTPNKFKEFDVHLVGQGQRNPSATTNARSYSKPKIELVEKENVNSLNALSEKNIGQVEASSSETTDGNNQSNANESDSVDELPDLDSPTRGLKAAQGRSKGEDTDLVCHVCNKTFISKFGLMTHSISHPDLSTRCHLCDQGFATHKGLVMHNVIVHKIIESRNETNSTRSRLRLHGFEDLVSVEFSADKFPLIAEAACSQVRHRHPEADRQHIFVCKKCDKAFPLLLSLEFHVRKEHGEPQNTENMNDGVTEKGNRPDFMQSLGLCKQDKENRTKVEKEDVQSIKNGMDDDAIYASQTVAADVVPAWLRSPPDLSISGYKNEADVLVKRPRITLKIVRKRSAPLTLLSNSDERASNGQDVSDGYFIDGTIARKRSITSNAKGNKATSSSQALSRFGVPNKRMESMNSMGSGERNVFWCRICNYSSHEKSALVRHLLTHSGIRPYFCKRCNYAFTTKANCERHVRKRHNCRDKAEIDATVQCDWEMLKKAPRDDIYMITGSNSACPVCAKTFPCNNDLKEHLKVHEERLFICQLCNIRCTTRNNCVRHILHKHPGIPHQEANNIITFAGSKSKNLDMRKLSDIVKDRPDIDISKGSLGGRNSLKPPTNTRLKLKRSSPFQDDESYRKKQKTLFNPPKQNQTSAEERYESVCEEQQLGAPVDVPMTSSAEKDDHHNNEKHIPKRRMKELLPLIPLLKIKAYNEAVEGTYARMLSMYQGLNFFKNFLANSNDMTNLGNMEDNASEMDASTRNDRTRSIEQAEKTVFTCHTCSATFDVEEEFNCHAASCLGGETDNRSEIFAIDEYQVFNSLDGAVENQMTEFGTERAQEYPLDMDSQNDNYLSNEINSDGSLGEQDSGGDGNLCGSPRNTEIVLPALSTPRAGAADNIVNLSQGANASSHSQVFEGEFHSVGDWVDSVVPHSPSSGKSMGTPTQSDFSSPFITEGPRVFASNGKESSYVEDSLLLSMFGDGGSRKGERAGGIGESSMKDSIMSVSRYSASFPTMVNMDNPALSRMKFHDSSSMEDKVLVPSKGRFYTARKCPQCDKTFPWASSLRRHIMTHTGLKLYMCRLCKMRFTTRSNLIRHVYRRHGMAKQHPDFAACLAKLHPSDTLLKEVEADVRRRFDGQKKAVPQVEEAEIDGDSNLDEDDLQEDGRNLGRRRAVTSDFQSMLEEDPETMLVDLDYSPRDDLPVEDLKKARPRLVVKSPMKKKVEQPTSEDADLIDEAVEEDLSLGQDSLLPEDEAAEVSPEEVEQEQPIDMSLSINLPEEGSFEEASPAVNGTEVTPYYQKGKSLRLRSVSRSSANRHGDEAGSQGNRSFEAKKKDPIYKSSPKPKIRNKQSTQFVCGLCKKIFKTVPDLIEHLDTHNVPHSWHCPVCGVPFTNKYNCQRHLTRRHGAFDVEPLYVEDSKHGPRTARGHPRKTPAPSEDGNVSLNSV